MKRALVFLILLGTSSLGSGNESAWVFTAPQQKSADPPFVFKVQESKPDLVTASGQTIRWNGSTYVYLEQNGVPAVARQHPFATPAVPSRTPTTAAPPAVTSPPPAGRPGRSGGGTATEPTYTLVPSAVRFGTTNCPPSG